MTIPRVGIVVVNWSLAEDTMACLESVFRMSYPAFDVIVVDNGSTDDSVEQIGRAFPQVHQLLNDENRGFAAGANQGIEQALAMGCQYVLVLNNDTVVAPDLLDCLVAMGEANPQIGILSPRILFFHEPERTWHLAARWHRWLPLPVNVWQADGPLVEADFVTGCGMLLTRRLLQEIGAFDPHLFMYGEDVDLCARAKRAGYRVVAVPGARLWHKVSISTGKASTDILYWRARNRILVCRRYRHGPLAGLAPAYGLIKAAIELSQNLIRGQTARIGPALRGVRDGLREPVP